MLQGTLTLQCHQSCLCVFLKQSFLREMTNTCIMNNNSLRPPQYSETSSPSKFQLGLSKSHTKAALSFCPAPSFSVSPTGKLLPTLTVKTSLQKQLSPEYTLPHIFLAPHAQLTTRACGLFFHRASCTGPSPRRPVPSGLHARSPDAAPFLGCLILTLPLSPRPSTQTPHWIPLNVSWVPIFYCISARLLYLPFKTLPTLLPMSFLSYILCPGWTVTCLPQIIP